MTRLQEYDIIKSIENLNFMKQITTLRSVETAKIHHILRYVGVKTK